MKHEKLNEDVFNGQGPTTKPLFDNEIDLKVAMLKDAIETGEADHLHPDQSFKARYQRSMQRIADKALQENFGLSREDQLLQSIYGMIYTLIEEGETEQLNTCLEQAFPQYYDISIK